MPVINKGKVERPNREQQTYRCHEQSSVTSTQLTSRSVKKKLYTQNMCFYIKIAPHCRLSIECLEIKNKCRQRNSKYEVKSFKQVGIEKYMTPLAGSILTNRSRVWPVNFFINTSKVSSCQRIVNTAVKCHIISFLRFGGGNEKFAEIRAGSLYSRLLTRLRFAESLLYLICAPKCEPARRLVTIRC